MTLPRWYWRWRSWRFDARLVRATRVYLKWRAQQLLPSTEWPLEYLPGFVLVIEFAYPITRRHVDALFIHFGHWVDADETRAHEWRELRIARLVELWLSQEPWEAIIDTIDRVSKR